MAMREYKYGYRDGMVGYYDKWYEDKSYWKDYLSGYQAAMKERIAKGEKDFPIYVIQNAY